MHTTSFHVHEIIYCTQYHSMHNNVSQTELTYAQEKSCVEQESDLLYLTSSVGSTQCFKIHNRKSKLTIYQKSYKDTNILSWTRQHFMHMASFYAHEMISCTRNHFMHPTSFHAQNIIAWTQQCFANKGYLCTRKAVLIAKQFILFNDWCQYHSMFQTIKPETKTNQLLRILSKTQYHFMNTTAFHKQDIISSTWHHFMHTKWFHAHETSFHDHNNVCEHNAILWRRNPFANATVPR